MARKNKKLLSTLRALDDKQEPKVNQHGLEEKPAIAPFLDAGAEESELKLQESELTRSVVAPLLNSSLLEEQLSLVTEPTSIIDPVPTAESLHIADLTEQVDATTPTDTSVVTSAVTPETSEPSQDQAIAEVETESEAETQAEVKTEEDVEVETQTEAEAAPQPEAIPPAETSPTEAVSEAPEETSQTQLQPEETNTSVELVQTTPQPTQAIADPIDSEPTDNSQVVEPADGSGEATEADNAAIATPSKEELLKRPEAPVLIIVAFLASLWQAYVNTWAKPAPTQQRSSQKNT